MNNSISKLLAATIVAGSSIYASAQNPDAKYDNWPTYDGSDLELLVDNSGTHFTLWSPEAQAAKVLLYDTDRNTPATDTLDMKKANQGTWRVSVDKPLYGLSLIHI